MVWIFIRQTLNTQELTMVSEVGHVNAYLENDIFASDAIFRVEYVGKVTVHGDMFGDLIYNRVDL